MTDYEMKLKEKKDAYNAALNKYLGANKDFAFKFSKQNELNKAKNTYANYSDFSFDINKDAFYKDAVDQYTKLGKLAMEDTIGQASAMTGGYGNSYAQSVGQQAYQGQLDNLGDVAIDLYDRALERYKMGKSDLYNQIAMLEDERVNEYNEKFSNRENYLANLYNDVELAKGEYEAMLPTESSLEDYKLGADLLKILSENPELYDEYPQLFDKYLKGTTLEEDLTPKPEKESVNWLGFLTPSMDLNTATKDPSNPTATPKESTSDYADWDYGDWENYFATIRNTEGKSAAEEELSRMNKAGLIPKSFIVAASIGARGSFGH
jgi:hypothetical protein